MTYATEKQVAYIASLARAKGMTKTEALMDYGLNPGETLTVALASDVINHLKGLSVEQADAERAAFKAASAQPAEAASIVGRRVFVTGRGEGVAIEQVKKAVTVQFDSGAVMKIAAMNVEAR